MSQQHEHDWEPVRGLPEALPAGERMLWQGAPDWRRLAVEAFHLRTAGLYLLACWGVAFLAALADGSGWAVGLQAGLWLGLAGAVGGGMLAGFAFLYARSTVFTITTKRVIIRFGLAIPKAVNLPFTRIESAALKLGRRGVGDIPLALVAEDRAAFLHLWPFVRPGRFARPEPMLRATPAAALAAEVLARALRQDLLLRGGEQIAAAPASVSRSGAATPARLPTEAAHHPAPHGASASPA